MKQSVDHVATFCGFLVAVNYKLRHDEVLKIIVFGMMRKLGLLDSFVKLRDFKPPKARTWVRKGGDVVFTTDAEVQTTNKVQYNKPDIFVKDSRSKKVIIGEIGITSQHCLMERDLEKSTKYDYLIANLKSTYPGYSVLYFAIVMTWDGVMSKRTFKDLTEVLHLNKRQIAYMQLVSLRKTLSMVRSRYQGKNMNFVSEGSSPEQESSDMEEFRRAVEREREKRTKGVKRVKVENQLLSTSVSLAVEEDLGVEPGESWRGEEKRSVEVSKTEEVNEVSIQTGESVTELVPGVMQNETREKLF